MYAYSYNTIILIIVILTVCMCVENNETIISIPLLLYNCSSQHKSWHYKKIGTKIVLFTAFRHSNMKQRIFELSVTLFAI